MTGLYPDVVEAQFKFLARLLYFFDSRSVEVIRYEEVVKAVSAPKCVFY